LAAQSSSVRPDDDASRDHERRKAAVVVGQGAGLVRHYREAEGLRESSLELVQPWAQDVAVERDRLDPAPDVEAALRVRVVVAITRTEGEPHAGCLEKRHH